MDALSAAGGQLFDGSCEAGLLVKPDQDDPPVEFFSDSGSFDIHRRSPISSDSPLQSRNRGDGQAWTSRHRGGHGERHLGLYGARRSPLRYQPTP